MLQIAILGPPGAGKGTQSRWLIETYNLLHLSPGDLFRRAVKDGNTLGRKVQQYIDQGVLVPNALVNQLISAQMAANSQAGGFLFDGYPRTYMQACDLDKQLAKNGHPLDLVLLLETKEEVLRKRIQYRSKTEDRVDDQDPGKFITRMRCYYKEKETIISYYQDQDKLVTIDTTPSISIVAKRLQKAITAAKSNLF